jgi:hypothetical protein
MQKNKQPSVTQCLPPIDFFCTKEELEAARQEGIEFHAKMDMYFSTGVTFDDPDIIAVDKILTEHSRALGALVLHEERLNSSFKFTGQPDAIFEKAIVDFKRTRSNDKRLALQLAGYHILAVENKNIKPTKKWYCIYGKDGDWKIANVYDPQAEDIFMALLKKYYIDIAIKRYMEG